LSLVSNIRIITDDTAATVTTDDVWFGGDVVMLAVGSCFGCYFQVDIWEKK
jgi:hypothetical protein